MKKLLALAFLSALLICPSKNAISQTANADVPKFEVQPFWPKALPNKWVLGQAAGVAVDKNDHIWVVHRPGTVEKDELGAAVNPPTAKCCIPAPPVLEFDREGNLLRSWGGPGQGYDWPKSEHGIFVDSDGNVWLAGNGKEDNQILKFTPDGKFLMQIGKAGASEGSNSQTQLGRPAHMMIDEPAGELYVADGYGNHRVVVFDAMTGAYKRHWGAYGDAPSDEKQAAYVPKTPFSKQFANPVHCVRIANDGLVYICDRANDRIQVFEKTGKFVKEIHVNPETLAGGSVWDIALSTDEGQKYIFVADGTDGEIVTVLRDSGEPLGSFGRIGRQAGQFEWVHNMAIDSQGNLYTTEVGSGRRAQMFKRVN